MCIRRICLTLILYFLILAAGPVWGSPTGLNNIPTADVVPKELLVFQYYNFIETNGRADHFGAFKYGLTSNIEVGLDGRGASDTDADEFLVAQAKLRFDLSDSLAMAAGIANLGDRATAGREYPYAVFSNDFGFVRAHLGTTAQKDNEGIFVGLDRTFKLFERDLILRSDLIETNKRDDTIISTGFLYDLGQNWLLESWVSWPSESRSDEVYTIKLNYVVRF